MVGTFLIHYFQNGFCFLIVLKQRVDENYPNRRPVCKSGPVLVLDDISLLKVTSQKYVDPKSDIMSAQHRNEEFYLLQYLPGKHFTSLYFHLL
jgi:hypothetical protein